MSRERCWKCKKVKAGVVLRACDDRLCEQCFEDNEKALRALRTSPSVSDNGSINSASSSRADSVGARVKVGSQMNCCLCSKAGGQLKCCVCDKHFHGTCVGIARDMLTAVSPFIGDIGWVCLVCRDAARSVIHQLKSGYSKLSEETVSLKNEVADLSATVIGLKAEVDEIVNQKSISSSNTVKPDTSVLAAMHTELIDKQRRARNVVMHGLEKEDGVDDIDVFTVFCQNNLPVKPVVVKCRLLVGTKLEECSRSWLHCAVKKQLLISYIHLRLCEGPATVRYSPSLLIQTEPQQKHLQLINSDRDGDKDRLMEWAARKYVPRCTSCLPPQRTSHLVCRMHRVMFSTSLHSIDSVSDCHGSGSHTLTHTYSTNCDDVLYPVVYLINATSLAKNNAVEQLTVDVVHHKVHVVIVTESWLTEKHTDGCLSIPNYTLYRRDRHKRKGGGVCVFVRSDVDCEILPVCNDLNVEILWLRCTFHGYVCYVAGCYCPPKPKYDVGLFKCTLEDGIEMFSRDVGSEIIIIAGMLAIIIRLTVSS